MKTTLFEPAGARSIAFASVLIAMALGGCSSAPPGEAESEGTTSLAATTSSSGCSAWKLYAKRACLAIGDANGETTFTATMEVGPGGRGWYGYVELTGPEGSLAKTGTQLSQAPSKVSVSYETASPPPGKYCAIDWRWDVYHSVYFQEAEYCTQL
jgi:hypothetical protein